MGTYIAAIHSAIAFLTFFYFIPKKTEISGDFYYESEFNDNFPTFSRTNYWLLFSLIIYVTLDYLFINYFYIDSFEDSYFIIIVAVLTVPIFSILYKLYSVEIAFVSDNFKKKRPFIIWSIYLYLYAISVLFSCVLIYNANHFLDNSKTDEHIVNITNLSSRIEGSGKFKVRYYYLIIDPPLCGKNIIYVPKDFYRKCKKDIKIKLNVGKGLFGQRYLSKKMDIMK